MGGRRADTLDNPARAGALGHKKKELELAVRVALWQRETRDATEYDCGDCRLKGRDKQRACYRFRAENHVREARPVRDGVLIDDEKLHFVGLDDAWRRIRKLESWAAPRLNVMQAAEALGVCPEGLLLSREIAEWIELEQVCKTYHIAPTDGSVEEMPGVLYDAFLVITRTRSRCEAEMMDRARRRQQAGAQAAQHRGR